MKEIMQAHMERFGTDGVEERPRELAPASHIKLRTVRKSKLSDSPPPADMLVSRGPQRARERLRRERKSASANLTRVASLIKTRTRKKTRS